jgi:elongation factor G
LIVTLIKAQRQKERRYTSHGGGKQALSSLQVDKGYMEKRQDRQTENIASRHHERILTLVKTTVSERILFYSGRLHRIGEVHEGAATMDVMEQERERVGSRFYSAATTVIGRITKINIIDTPGHSNLRSSSNALCAVARRAVAVLLCSSWMQPPPKPFGEQAPRYERTAHRIRQKMDRTGADFFKAVRSMREKLHATAIPVQCPIGAEAGFKGMVDLIAMKAYLFHDETLGAKYDVEEIPADMLDQCKKMRMELLRDRHDR